MRSRFTGVSDLATTGLTLVVVRGVATTMAAEWVKIMSTIAGLHAPKIALIAPSMKLDLSFVHCVRTTACLDSILLATAGMLLRGAR